MYTYVREDGKHFTKPIHDAAEFHIDIVSEDGEKDTVKWYGTDNVGELYVSLAKGYGYRRVEV